MRLLLFSSLLLLGACNTAQRIDFRGLDYDMEPKEVALPYCKSNVVHVTFEGDPLDKGHNLWLENKGQKAVEINIAQLAVLLGNQIAFPLKANNDPMVTTIASDGYALSRSTAATSTWITSTQSSSRALAIVLPGEKLRVEIDNVPRSIYLNNHYLLRSEFESLEESLSYRKVCALEGNDKAQEWLTKKRLSILSKAENLPSTLDNGSLTVRVPFRWITGNEWEYSCISYKISNAQDVTSGKGSFSKKSFIVHKKANLESWRLIYGFPYDWKPGR